MKRPTKYAVVALMFSAAVAIAAPTASAAEHGGGGGGGGHFGGGGGGHFGGGGAHFGGGGHAGFGGTHFGGAGHGGFDHGGFGHGGRFDFHGRDFAHFSVGERRLWEGGHWLHNWHAGLFGWWWLVGAEWYYYPEPIYPYPTYVPDASVGEPALNALAPAPNWYVCDNPQGYYPYIANCDVPWRAVPTTPAGIQPPAALLPPPPRG